MAAFQPQAPRKTSLKKTTARKFEFQNTSRENLQGRKQTGNPLIFQRLCILQAFERALGDPDPISSIREQLSLNIQVKIFRNSNYRSRYSAKKERNGHLSIFIKLHFAGFHKMATIQQVVFEKNKH